MAKKSVIIRRVATDGGDKWATWVAVAQKPRLRPTLLLRKIQRGANHGNGFPKTLNYEEVGKVLYNFAAASQVSTFATLPFHFPPQSSHFQFHIHTCSHRQTLIGSERWRQRRERPNQRKQAPRRQAPAPDVTKSGCRREWERQS